MPEPQGSVGSNPTRSANLENSMLAKFTNAHPGREGDPIYINVNVIKSVYEDGSPSLQTKIAGPDVVWTVEEGLSEVVKTINSLFNT